MKKLIFITLVLLTYSFNSFGGSTYFIDFYKVLNNSKPGSQAQNNLKEKFNSETKKYKKLEENIRKKKSEIIAQKKVLYNEEYQKKIQALRKKVANLQKDKKKSFNNITKSRNNAREVLLKAVNPIVQEYMEKNKIEIVLERKGVVLGNSNLEITDQIISILNKELPTLKLN